MGAGALPFPFVCADGVRECMNVFFPKGCAVPLHIASLGVLQLGGIVVVKEGQDGAVLGEEGLRVGIAVAYQFK